MRTLLMNMSYALFDTLVISKMSVLDRSLLFNENFNS